MDTIQIILRFLTKVAIFLSIAIVLLWIIRLFFPDFNLKNALLLYGKSNTSTSTHDSWLPAPGSMTDLFKLTTGTSTEFNVIYYEPTNEPGYSQVGYTNYSSTNGEMVDPNKKTSPSKDSQSYIRSITIYKGGHIYTGLSFSGEAKNTMFRNGKFPIIIVDDTGKVVSISEAVAKSNWTIPGWTKFYVKITDVLPNRVPCAMIFQSASKDQYSYQIEEPIRVAIPMMCN